MAVLKGCIEIVTGETEKAGDHCKGVSFFQSKGYMCAVTCFRYCNIPVCYTNNKKFYIEEELDNTPLMVKLVGSYRVLFKELGYKEVRHIEKLLNL